MGFLTPTERSRLRAAMDRLVPGDGEVPAAGEAGGVHYVERLLCAFDHDPPHIWSDGSGGWVPLGAAEELAWRIRIEGTAGVPEREFNGPALGWRHRYRAGLAATTDDGDITDEAFRDLVFAHAAESLYGDPAYGGNRDRSAWRAVGFDGDVQPRGWTDDEVTMVHLLDDRDRP